jgi:hypothetical protein
MFPVRNYDRDHYTLRRFLCNDIFAAFPAKIIELLNDEFWALFRRGKSVIVEPIFLLAEDRLPAGLYQAECEIQSGQSRVAPSQPVARVF